MGTKISNVISEITLSNYERIIDFNNTPANTGDAAYTALHTYALTNAQANYDYIKIDCDCGYALEVGDGSEAGTGYVAIFSGATQKTGAEVNTAEGVMHFNRSGSGAPFPSCKLLGKTSFILTAGVDYTKATAFNLIIKGKTGGPKGTVYAFKSVVSGWVS